MCLKFAQLVSSTLVTTEVWVNLGLCEPKQDGPEEGWSDAGKIDGVRKRE